MKSNFLSKSIFITATLLAATNWAYAQDMDLRPQEGHLDEIRPTTLQGKVEDLEASSEFKAALEKLRAGTKLSSGEYRSLHIGCTGYEGYRAYFQKTTLVTRVYRGSPAENAGLKRGDKLIESEVKENSQTWAHPETAQYQVRFGREGSQVNLTVLRPDGPERITLTRMNIEDIQEERYRKQWETIVSELGFPEEGTFVGNNLHSLSPTK